MFQDRTLTCVDCGQPFMFSATEQQFFADRQFSDPRRCGPCRANRKAGRSDRAFGSGDRGPRTMFTATCTNCGREAQVPFEPTSGKPVYCDDCFATRRGRMR